MRLIDADALEPDAEYDDGEYWAFSRTQIENAPTIEPERKRGRWAEFDSDEDKFGVIKCSCCKHTFTVNSYHLTDIGFVKDDFNFCPNCGADMREGEQE